MDIESNILEKIGICRKLALQFDESTNINGHAQLFAKVRFVDEDVIKKYFFLLQKIAQNTTAEEIFCVVFDYIEWKNCINVCTDGAAAMVGRYKGFVSRIREKQPDIVVTHFFCPERCWLHGCCPQIWLVYLTLL